MRISLHKTVCMTLVINGSWCLAQPLVSRDDDHLQFQHVTAADGLSDNGVTCIFEDAEGYIWIGTERGLNRYDGQQVQQFSGPGRAPCGSHITSIAQDSAGVIWIASSDKGLSRFHSDTGGFTCYPGDTLQSTGTLSVRLNHITALNDSMLVICSQDGGLIWYNTRSNTSISRKYPITSSLSSIQAECG